MTRQRGRRIVGARRLRGKVWYIRKLRRAFIFERTSTEASVTGGGGSQVFRDWATKARPSCPLFVFHRGTPSSLASLARWGADLSVTPPARRPR